MNSAFDFLKAGGVFYLATCDGSKARVRPFGFSMKWNGRLYFCTNKTKDVYKQMAASPDVEISTMGADRTSLRIRGRIAFDDGRETKAQAFKDSPDLLRIYKKGVDDETFVTFYFTEAEATLYSFAQAPKKLPLL